MRKNCARKWLHFVLDLLPVILIPVFMIYSHRHTLTERTEVDVQYKYQTNDVNSFNDIVSNNVYHADFLDVTDDILVNEDFLIKIYTFEEFTFDTNIEEYLDNYYFDNYNNENNYILITCYANSLRYNVKLTNDNAFSSYTMSSEDVYLSITNCDFSLSGGYNEYLTILENNFGYDINNYSSSTFNVIESVDVQDTNSDIMSVFMDDFNNAVDKYFNFNSVFNFQDIKDWATDNLFGGTMPPVAQSVYNIIVYEFIMDIIFLMYAVFMFIIDFAEDCLERPFNRIKRG